MAYWVSYKCLQSHIQNLYSNLKFGPKKIIYPVCYGIKKSNKYPFDSIYPNICPLIFINNNSLLLITYTLAPEDLASSQYFMNNGRISFDASLGLISQRSDFSSGRRYPFHAIGSNHVKNKRDKKLALSSGHGFSDFWYFICVGSRSA